jgi:hypothetical protein
MVSYDAEVIVQFAERLYKQSGSFAATYAVLGILVGAGVGAAGGSSLGGAALVVMAIGAVVGGAVGFSIGQQKAFALRLQAQVALCQVQIEANTRFGVAKVA